MKINKLLFSLSVIFTILFIVGRILSQHNNTAIVLNNEFMLPVNVSDGIITNNDLTDACFTLQDDAQCEITSGWQVDEPGFLIAFVITDQNGDVCYSTCATTITHTFQLTLSKGTYQLNYFFFNSADRLTDLSGTYHLFKSEKDLLSYIDRVDFPTLSKNGTWETEFTIHISSYTKSISPLIWGAFAASMIAWLLLLLQYNAYRKEQEHTENDHLLSPVALCYSIFALTTINAGIVLSTLIELLASPDDTTGLFTNLSLVRVAICIDLTGFPILHLITRRIPACSPAKNRLSLGDFLQYVFIGAALCGIGTFIGAPIHLVVSKLVGADSSTVLAQLMANSSIPLQLLVIGILAPVFEELIFRKYLIDRVGKYGEFTAILLSGLMFGLFHGNFQQFFYATMLGFLFAFVYLRTGNVLYTIAFHMIINSSSVLITTPLALAYAKTLSTLENPIDIFQTAPGILYFAWLGFLGLCALTGLIILIIKLCKGRFRLQKGPDTSAKHGAISLVFCNSYVWLFIMISIGLFIFTYMP